jgi:hypothetical protein
VNVLRGKMDLLILEVDGSLANPYAAGAVAVWTVILTIVSDCSGFGALGEPDAAPRRPFYSRRVFSSPSKHSS